MKTIFSLLLTSLLIASLLGVRPAHAEDFACSDFESIFRFVQTEHLRMSISSEDELKYLITEAAAFLGDHLRNLGYWMMAADYEKTLAPRLAKKFPGSPFALCEALPTAIHRGAFLKAYLKSLDPYSDFQLSEEMDVKTSVVDGEFVGAGIATEPLENALFVKEVVEGGPSDGKLKAGDLILSIDGHTVMGLKELELRKRIRGIAGTVVMFEVKRAGKLLSVAITRGKVQQKSTSFRFSDDGVLFAKVHRFYQQTPMEVSLQMAKHRKNLKGVILDLRDNPGGLLQAARDLVDLFVATGVVVYLKGKSQQDQVWAMNADGDLQTPLVVLVNQYTASASEIVAGALQDYGRALVVGSRTFGKGSVQNVFETQSLLGTTYRGGLKLTTLWYYLPSGKNVELLEPDVLLNPTEEQENFNAPKMPYRGPDRIPVLPLNLHRAAVRAQTRVAVREEEHKSAEEIGRALLQSMAVSR